MDKQKYLNLQLKEVHYMLPFFFIFKIQSFP